MEDLGVAGEHTAIMLLGDEELHLVAVRSKKHAGIFPCFWGFTVAAGLYKSCLVMLNLRCLGIVFDLDETLLVANTKRSFEDRIESLQRKINSENDPQRVASMLAEMKRYQEDKFLLKQYSDNDEVVDNGIVIKSQLEVVPALSDNHQPMLRPLIRLQDKNVILTRINPQIRDTSVLVRLRPSWEDFRIYLTARGRKRFEVYVCTMAEREYALEMWRLLDPQSNLINPKEMLDRIVCVQSGSLKSLFNVFQDRYCHPKMALVIDDRMKVWDERDQPRVHVVPAFAPYRAPQAEANNSVPVLCVARNVACNVRGSFFRDFDEGLLQRISEVAYEDDIKEIPSSPDVSNYLITEDDTSASSRSNETLNFDGMADAEVEKRLKGPVVPFTSQQLIPANPVPKPAVTNTSSSDLTSLQRTPVTEEGELPETEVDPDTRRRLLILQHGLDSRKHAHPVQVPVPGLPNRDRFFKEPHQRDDHVRLNQSQPSFQSFSGNEVPFAQSSGSRDVVDLEPGQIDPRLETPSGTLQNIAFKCGTKVEFKPVLLSTTDLQFSMEVWFAGERIGEGIGRSRKEAHGLAAEKALMNLADKYISLAKPNSTSASGDSSRFPISNDANIYGYRSFPKEGVASSLTPSEPPRVLDPRLEAQRRSMGPIAALRELCIMEGLGLAFQTQPQLPTRPGQRAEVFAVVRIDGQVAGKGIGSTWDDAKAQAAEMALGTLKPMYGHFPSKRPSSPRSEMSNKRYKQEDPRTFPRMPPSARFL